MFWDRVAWVYDIFADGINRKANRALCASVKKMILPTDNVLECACGTGLLTAVISPSCKQLTATVFSEKMLKRAKKKCKKFGNVQFAQTDILHLPYPDGCFDAVVAASDAIGKAGANFKHEFTLDTYQTFFSDVGYANASYTLCEGRIPCAVALLHKK